MSAFAAKPPSVLNISFYAVGVKPVSGIERINHIKVLPGVRNAVTARIAHLVLLAILLD